MKIAIIGTGGVGGYFGGKLAKSDNQVTFLARGKHLEAIHQNGLVVNSINGNFKVTKARVTDSINSIGLVDLVLICTKAWQVKEVAKELNSIIGPQTVVIPLQNGVLAADELIEQIPSTHVVGGLCRIFSMIDSPGVINHVGIEPTIVFGELDGVITPRIEKVKMVFDGAGFKSKVSDDIHTELWKKFIAICVSALLAVTKTTYGEIRELPETRQMIVDLFKEIYTLSQKEGAKIKPDFVDQSISFIDTFPFDATSSLTRDVWEGKPSEIEYQNGTVVRLAQKHGLNVPVNRFVYNCILPMELKARSKKKYL